MKWYSVLYAGETARKKKNKIICKLKTGAGMLDVYLVTLSGNQHDLLEIISSAYLKQKVVRRNLPMILGIACGYEEAVEVAVEIVSETYAKTGDFKVSRYLADKAANESHRGPFAGSIKESRR